MTPAIVKPNPETFSYPVEDIISEPSGRVGGKACYKGEGFAEGTDST